MPILPGHRERLRRGGYPTRREAIAARDALLGDGDTAIAEGWTMQRWLRYWLTTRTKIRPTTLRSYETHVENHLIPHLGRVRLSELTGRHITDMITTIGATTNRYGRPPTPSTLHRRAGRLQHPHPCSRASARALPLRRRHAISRAGLSRPVQRRR